MFISQEKKLEEEDEALIKSIVFNVSSLFLCVFPLPFIVISFGFLFQGVTNFNMRLSLLLCRNQTIMLEEFRMMNLMITIILYNIRPTMMKHLTFVQR